MVSDAEFEMNRLNRAEARKNCFLLEILYFFQHNEALLSKVAFPFLHQFLYAESVINSNQW